MKIYFLEINFFSFIPVLMLRFLGYEIYFLDVIPCFRNAKFLETLSKFKIYWLSHQSNLDIKGGAIYREVFEVSGKVANTLSKTLGAKKLSEIAILGDDLENILHGRVFNQYSRHIELMEIVRFLNPVLIEGKQKIWMPKTVISGMILKYYNDVENICPKFYSFTEVFFTALMRVIDRAVKKIINKITLKQNNIGNIPAKNSNTKISYLDIQVCFFPHKGIMYGEMYKKDYFYSQNESSEFNPKKIAHIEIDSSPPKISRNYYDQNKIINFLWTDLPYKKSLLTLIILKLIYSFIKSSKNLLDLDTIITYLYICIKVTESGLRIKNLPNLKVALIGYDILFSPLICVALKNFGIKTVAAQERSIASWCMPPLIADHFFIFCTPAKNKLKSIGTSKTNYIDIASIRSKDYLLAKKPDIISEIRKKFNYIVLILDMHSELDWYENGRRVINNWRNNKVLYENVIRLSNEFPDLFFMIKGKDTAFTKIPYFKEVLQKIIERPNLMIISDYVTWTPFTATASSDIIIARHTSLADEAFSIGKPVIIYDYDGFPSELFNFGSEITSNTYNDLSDKLNRFRLDPVHYNSNLESLRKAIFNSELVNVTSKLISDHLNKVIHS